MQSIAVKPAITVPLAFQPIISQLYLATIHRYWHHPLGAIILSITRIKAVAVKRCLKKQELS